VVKALDYRRRGPRFQPLYSNGDFFRLGVYSALPKKCISNHCGKPLRGNKNKTEEINKWLHLFGIVLANDKV